MAHRHTPGERELVAAHVSAVNSCRFCFGAHSRLAKAFGIGKTTIPRMLDDLDAVPVDSRLTPILRYARKLTGTLSRLTEADATAVYDAWSDEALLHATAVCAYSNESTC